MKNAFGRRMTLLRRQKGITQKQAAARLGISQALLSHYEKGVRECGLDFLNRAADFYGVTADYLLGRADLPAEPVTAAERYGLRLRAATEVLLDALQQTGDEALVESAALFLAQTYRDLLEEMTADRAGPGNDVLRLARASARAAMAKGDLCTRLAAAQPLPNADALRKQYGSDFALLYDLVEQTDKEME